MTNPFPIGESQLLSITGGPSLTLDSCAFDASEFAGLGYWRKDQSPWLEPDYSIYGTFISRSKAYRVKQEFEWALKLTAAEFFTLKAIIQLQQNRLNLRIAGSEIKLQDKRLVWLEQTPRVRAKVLTPVITEIPPAGFEYMWAIYNIYVTEFTEEFFYAHGSSYWKVSLKAVEADLTVPGAEDFP